MSASSSKPQRLPPPHHLPLHVDTSATAATNTNSSAASPGSASFSRAPRPTPTGRGGGSRSTEYNNQACAACKFRRCKCYLDCPLGPYFPADQQSRFTNAQRLFGTSNIQKRLTKYGPAAMCSLIYQSEARAADPVRGCVGIIQELRRQLREFEMELQFVRKQIAIQQASATDGGLSDPAAMILPAASSPVVAAGQQDDMVAAVDAICASQQPSIHQQSPAVALSASSWGSTARR